MPWEWMEGEACLAFTGNVLMNTPTTIGRSVPIMGACTFAFLVLSASLAIYALLPPSPLPANAPASEFSAERALKHSRVIAQVPHPAGSAANDEVRGYLLGQLKMMGVAAEEQVDRSVHGRTAAERKNVLGRIPGTANTKAFALTAHYDSVPYGPGAADDGGGVVAMLETARAIMAGAPLRNDIIFVFTDAEESGEQGAVCFTRHPWAAEVGVLLNLESRGTAGPSLMFETSPDNGWLISELAKAGTYTRASSLMYDVYKRMPFDSDFSVFKRNGFAGFNIAFVDNFAYYHTKSDTPDHLSLASLQNHGSYALGLARHFGNIPLDRPIAAPDAVYFNTVGSHLIHYPLSWSLRVALLAVLVFLSAVVLGLARGHLTLGGIAAGVGAFAVSAAGVSLFTLLPLGIAYGPQKLYTQYRTSITHLPDLKALYHNSLYGWAFAALALCVFTLCLLGFRRYLRISHLAIGALLWWAVVLLPLQRYLSGGSYYAAWPLLFSSLGLGISFLRAEEQPLLPWQTALLSVFALPGIFLLAPAYQAFLATVMIFTAPALVLMIVLPLGLLIPQLDLITTSRKWWLPAVSGGVGVILLVFGLAASGYSAERPKLNCMAYGLDLDTQKAFWMSADKELDEWTSRFFPVTAQDPSRGAITEFVPWDRSEYWKAPAPIAAYAGPQLQVISDTVKNDARELTLRVTAPDKPSELGLSMVSDAEVLSATVFGEPVDGARQDWHMSFRGFPREGADITLKIAPAARVAVKTDERLYGLPDLPGVPPRPDYMESEPNTIRRNKSLRSNHIFVTRTFEFPSGT